MTLVTLCVLQRLLQPICSTNPFDLSRFPFSISRGVNRFVQALPS
jgi:hypothetical protein